MIKIRKIKILAIVVGILSAVNMTSFTARASASEVPDLNRKGSITVDVQASDTGEAVSGGILTLYRAASAEQTSEGFRFELTDAFKESKADFSGIGESNTGAKELADELELYVSAKKLSGKSVTVGENGQAVWKELKAGVYLIINTASADGYESLKPFLVTVPEYLSGAYVYDVQAKPKSGSAHPQSTDKADWRGSSSDASFTHGSTAQNVLPQTGQLWWPVPVLALTGMLSLLLGWYRRRRYA